MPSSVEQFLLDCAARAGELHTYFVIANSRTFDRKDGASLATQIISQVSNLPETFFPRGVDVTALDVPLYFVTHHLKGIVALPAIRIFACEEELDHVGSDGVEFSIPRFKAALGALKKETPTWQKEDLIRYIALVLERAAQKDNKRRERTEKKRLLTMAPTLPASLQPSLRRFNDTDVTEWLEHVKTVYAKHGVDEDDVPMYIGSFLPDHAVATHEALVKEGAKWADYARTLITRLEADRSPSAIKEKILEMTQKANESVRVFAMRVHSVAQQAVPAIPDKEVCRLLLKILPRAETKYLIGANCSNVSDFIQRLESAVLDRKIVGGETSAQGQSSTTDWGQVLLDKLLQKEQQQKQDKVLAMVEALAGPKEKSVEDLILDKLQKLNVQGENTENKSSPVTEKVEKMWAVFQQQQPKKGQNRGRGGGQGGAQRYNGFQQPYAEPYGYRQAAYGAPYGGAPYGQQYQPFRGNYWQGEGNAQRRGGYSGARGGYRGGFAGSRGGYRGGHSGPQQGTVRACYGCQATDHLIAACPQRSAFLGQ